MFKAPPQKDLPKSLPPKGITVGRCYSIVDIGTQRTTWQGEEKLQRKVVLSFELPKHQKVFKEERGPEPFVVSQTFTLSMGAKSNLRQMIEGWLGVAMTKEEANDFDLASLVGKPCLITIAHETNEDKTYANIANITDVMDGVEIPSMINKPVVYQVSQGRDAVFKSLHEWMRKKIEASIELTQPTPVSAQKKAIPAIEQEAEIEGEVPF